MRHVPSLGLVGMLALAACNPDPVDPDADFTIRGRAVTAAGTAPAANTTVHIYKVDSIWRMEDNFLQSTSMEEGVGPDATYTAATDAAGNFSTVLKGREVNTDDGSGAAYLTVVYFDGGQANQVLATASDWHAFSNEDPTWELGSLKHWDGGTASQSGDDITFTWTSTPAPAGNSRITGLPYFLFAWDHGSAQSLPKWAAHTFDTSVVVPRAAFASGISTGAEYFVTGFSSPPGGGPSYQHRTALKTVTGGWTTSHGLTERVTQGALSYGTSALPFDANSASDRNIDTMYEFVGDVRDIWVDLGAPMQVDAVLLYNLGVIGMSNAVIGVEVSSQDTLSPDTWSAVGSPAVGDWEFQNWSYLATPNPSGSVRWVRIYVDRQGTSGSYPSFDFVSELSVLTY